MQEFGGVEAVLIVVFFVVIPFSIVGYYLVRIASVLKKQRQDQKQDK